MFKFGEKSEAALVGVHPQLVKVVRAALAAGVMDFSVNEGVRTEARQRELVAKGASKTMASKHLRQPDGFGHAVDLYPHPLDWAKVNKGNWVECARFGVLAGIIKVIAVGHGVKVIWGLDWDSDGQTLDHSFNDGPHFQIELP